MRNKVIIGISLFLLLVIGITYAWFTWNSEENTNVSVTIEGINITYEDGEDIKGINLIPVSSKEKGETDGTGVAKEIKVSSTMNAYLDLNMNLETLPVGLKDASFKWEFYKGEELKSSGNFLNNNQGDNISLLSQELVTSRETTYKLYIWIDGNMSNPNTMQNQTFKFMLNASATDNVSGEVVEPPLDDSGANRPKLVESMIPIMYDTNTSSWVKANTTEKDGNYKWYDYNNKKWANAVLVSQNNRQNYLDAEAGTQIVEDDILAYYVWIPRYKYKVFNITKTMGTDSYDAKTTGIDIEFENGTGSTGTVKCTDYSFVAPTVDSPNETCSGSNGGYYTHPAFTFGAKALTGIWVGKFETSSSTPGATYGGGETVDLTIRVKPNQNTWGYNTIDNFYKVVKDMQKSENEYGLSTDINTVDSHVMKNMEWGAVAYLTHSDYGRCDGNSCTEIGVNNYYTESGIAEEFRTGCGSKAGTGSSEICNPYDTASGMDASTTGNIYGIYDMSGGKEEWVMANMSNVSGSYTYYANNVGGNFVYNTQNEKYINTYAYGTSNNDQIAYNRTRLGDATGEVIISSEDSWYEDRARFANTTRPWMLRGGGDNGRTSSGIFNFYASDGMKHDYNTVRVTLLMY